MCIMSCLRLRFGGKCSKPQPRRRLRRHAEDHREHRAQYRAEPAPESHLHESLAEDAGMQPVGATLGAGRSAPLPPLQQHVVLDNLEMLASPERRYIGTAYTADTPIPLRHSSLSRNRLAGHHPHQLPMQAPEVPQAPQAPRVSRVSRVSPAAAAAPRLQRKSAVVDLRLLSRMNSYAALVAPAAPLAQRQHLPQPESGPEPQPMPWPLPRPLPRPQPQPQDQPQDQPPSHLGIRRTNSLTDGEQRAPRHAAAVLLHAPWIPHYSPRGRAMLQALRRQLHLPPHWSAAQTLVYMLQHPGVRHLALPSAAVEAALGAAVPSARQHDLLTVPFCNAISWDTILHAMDAASAALRRPHRTPSLAMLLPPGPVPARYSPCHARPVTPPHRFSAAERDLVTRWLHSGEPLFVRRTTLPDLLLRTDHRSRQQRRRRRRRRRQRRLDAARSLDDGRADSSPASPATDTAAADATAPADDDGSVINVRRADVETAAAARHVSSVYSPSLLSHEVLADDLTGGCLSPKWPQASH